MCCIATISFIGALSRQGCKVFLLLIIVSVMRAFLNPYHFCTFLQPNLIVSVNNLQNDQKCHVEVCYYSFFEIFAFLLQIHQAPGRQLSTHTIIAEGAMKQPLRYDPLLVAADTSCFLCNDWINTLIKMHLTHKLRNPLTFHRRAN